MLWILKKHHFRSSNMSAVLAVCFLRGLLYLTNFCDKWWLLPAQGACPLQATEAEQPVRIPRGSTKLSIAQWNGAFLLPGPAKATSFFLPLCDPFNETPRPPPLLFRVEHRWRQKEGKSLGGGGRVTGGRWYLAGWLVGGTLCDAMLHK